MRQNLSSRPAGGNRGFRVLLLLALLAIMASCAPREIKPEIAPYTGSVSSFLERAGAYNSLKGGFSVVFKKENGETLSADAAIEVAPGVFSIRLYRMGFPAGEFDGNMDARYPFLRPAVTDGLLWWRQIGPYSVKYLPDAIEVDSENRKLYLDKTTLAPVLQKIALPVGEATVAYSDPVPAGSGRQIPYPRIMRIIFENRELDLRARDFQLTTR